MPPENPRSQVEARNVTRPATTDTFTRENGYTDAPETARSSHNTTDPGESQERFRLMRLCQCGQCLGIGKVHRIETGSHIDRLESLVRCPDCRGEGRTLEEVATAPTEQAVGLALVQLGREGEFDECPFGLIDSEGEVGLKWLVRPWLPSPRNASDAGKLLRSIQTGKGKP